MRHARKIALLMLVGLLMVGLLAGCGGKKAEENPAPAAGATAPQKAAEPMKVMLYSSMKDSQLAALKDKFIKKYPNIAMDYYTAGTGKVMTKLATEQQAGGIIADVLWVGEPTNYLTLKEQGMLEAYQSPEAANIPAGLKDKDNYYTAARVVTLGFVYNVNIVKGNDIPKDWNDLLKPRFKDKMLMTDPTFSGTTEYTVAALVQNPKYGWDYIKALKANGMKLDTGSSGTVEKVGAGEYDVSIGVDYIAWTLKDKGTPLEFVHPASGIPTIASPIAIAKNTKNPEAAKILFDYIISAEGQELLVANNVIPVRTDVKSKQGVSVAETMNLALPIDDAMLLKGKEDMLKQFDAIMKTN